MDKVGDWEVKYFKDIESFNEGQGLCKRIPLLSNNGVLTMRNAAFVHFDKENQIVECIGGQGFGRAEWTKWVFGIYCPGFSLQFMSKAEICAAVEVSSRIADKVYLQAKSGKCYTTNNVVQLRR